MPADTDEAMSLKTEVGFAWNCVTTLSGTPVMRTLRMQAALLNGLVVVKECLPINFGIYW